MMLIFVIFVVSSFQLASAQAPGDSSQVCLRLRSRAARYEINYPINVKPLMDSRDYENLVPDQYSPVWQRYRDTNTVWQRVDRDNNNTAGVVTTVSLTLVVLVLLSFQADTFLQWTQLTDNPCAETIYVCGFSVGIQDNWLITQHISRVVDGVPLEQVNVEVEFQLIGCDPVLNCQRTFEINKYETSTISTSEAADIDNYNVVERLAPMDDFANVTENQTAVLDFETQETGFYVAIRDQGSCIVISRLLVFYYVCPAGVQDLIELPETIAPRIGQGSMQTGRCVPNASPTTNVSVECSSGGVWSTDVECTCDQGYAANLNRTACLRFGKYKNKEFEGTHNTITWTRFNLSIITVCVTYL